MKKIFCLFFIFVFYFYSNAQSFECNGMYTVVNSQDNKCFKNCEVKIDDSTARLFIFDTDVTVPVYDIEHIQSDITGDYYYLDECCESWVFHGMIGLDRICVVSVVSADERWTFTRTITNTDLTKR